MGLNKEAMQAMLKEQTDKGTLNAAVTQQDFLMALSKVKYCSTNSFVFYKFTDSYCLQVNKSVSENDLQKYSDWMAEFGSS